MQVKLRGQPAALTPWPSTPEAFPDVPGDAAGIIYSGILTLDLDLVLLHIGCFCSPKKLLGCSLAHSAFPVILGAPLLLLPGSVRGLLVTGEAGDPQGLRNMGKL